MSITSNRIVRQLVLLLALVNIVVMMVFQYWLPEYAMPGKENSSVEYTSAEDKNVGTIESVEQETAAKEAEEAQTALAREEESERPESVNADERDPDAPILELTDDHIYLNVGDRFNYMSYIKTMEDVDGSDLSHYIYLDQDVDTSQPGEIELTYRITSVITGKSDSKVLLITIRE
jgi:hypothetical protein